MSLFLTQAELAQLTGYNANQRVRIKRWLTQHGIEFRINRLGEPVVLRSRLDQDSQSAEPHFDALIR